MMNLFLLLSLFFLGLSISLPVSTEPTCMVIMSYFSPINIELKLPQIPNKRAKESFLLTLIEFNSQAPPIEQFLGDKTIFRQNYKLKESTICGDAGKLYRVCISIYTNSWRSIPTLYVGYLANESFEQLIGKIEVPEELKTEVNLKNIYSAAKKTTIMTKTIAAHQAKERKLQQELVGINVHKNHRIVTLTLLQIAVIIISGFYQIFALRKFLREKNIY